nr:MAG TPA: hypothetical protein [Caudoviricetes sp.]
MNLFILMKTIVVLTTLPTLISRICLLTDRM